MFYTFKGSCHAEDRYWHFWILFTVLDFFVATITSFWIEINIAWCVIRNVLLYYVKFIFILLQHIEKLRTLLKMTTPSLFFISVLWCRISTKCQPWHYSFIRTLLVCFLNKYGSFVLNRDQKLMQLTFLGKFPHTILCKRRPRWAKNEVFKVCFVNFSFSF